MKEHDNKTNPTDNLKDAVKIVQAAIKAKEDYYTKIANAEEQDPVRLDGTTMKNYCCSLMVDPKNVARIYLEHNYPVWSVLEKDAPTELWDDFAQFYGLKNVVSVDL